MASVGSRTQSPVFYFTGHSAVVPAVAVFYKNSESPQVIFKAYLFAGYVLPVIYLYVG
jgi:hypothetical protein